MKTILEVAKMFNINENTLRVWLKSDKITFHKIGKMYVFDENDIISVRIYILKRYNLNN